MASLAAFLGASTAEAFMLTLLHNNDGESSLINAGAGLENFGGVARFSSQVQALRQEAATRNSSSLLISSGDNFLAGAQFNASLALPQGQRFYDSIALDLIGYDAITIGNHEFDFGPDVLARFIADFENPVPFLSANLSFNGEPQLQVLVEQGRIARSTIVERDGERIGIVGATTPQLPFISSPRNVEINPDVAGSVQAEVDALAAQGINKIILSTHLQSIQEELDLVAQIRGVDIVIAGGGEEVLGSPTDNLIPGDEAEIFGSYPLLSATDATGKPIPVVTTPGNYRYVGRLVVEFDGAGDIVDIDSDRSGLVRIAGEGLPDAIAPDPMVQTRVVTPVETFVEDLVTNVIAQTEVPLDGRRDSVRTQEANLGNLLADSILFQGQQLAAEFGVPQPLIALQNGGGIRNDSIIGPGDLTEFDTFSVAAFSNFVSIIPDLDPQILKAVLENAYSAVEIRGGRFGQVAGLRIGIDLNETAQQTDVDGNIITPGSRVREVILDDGTVLIRNGQVLPDAPTVSVATIDFLARGGDQYFAPGTSFTSLGVTYQQALSNYIQQALGGVIQAEQYPFNTVTRISFDGSAPIGLGGDVEPIPEPGTAAGLLALGAIVATVRKRKRAA
ncbi:PEP-CTERM sorting domain-containing protein [Synechococcales cyanobacterium C]|uniref:PEP-CTERM sorting domain-containing protein n=2 Tax=Petrachloros TaxID=2918834 RepID=A0A8K2ABY6_9CYAN|nr:PEP-CTERM sorting domain-containing protein [Petrachloros mirabilis ULC683]